MKNQWIAKKFTIGILTGFLLLHAANAAETKASSAASTAGTNETATVIDPEAEKAWKEVKKSLQAPMPPAEWSGQRPTPEQVEAFRAEKARLAGAAIVKCKDFYTRYPNHPKAAEARDQEQSIRLYVLQSSLQQAFTTELGTNRADTFAKREKLTREMLKEYPEREDGYQLLMMLAGQAEPDKAKALANEVIASNKAPGGMKATAQGFLNKSEALGKPVTISFTAVDGREVDLAKMQGKVVMVDFWATWCGPCVAEIPNVKLAYEKLHAKGFEIVGISLDVDKDKLVNYTREKEMAWPQYFDGKQFENKFAVKYGINGIPAMWLVDKKGILRYLDVRGRLAESVETLLAE